MLIHGHPRVSLLRPPASIPFATVAPPVFIVVYIQNNMVDISSKFSIERLSNYH